MSHGASLVVAALFGFAVLLTAGIAGACSVHTTHTAEVPAEDGVVATGKKLLEETRG